MALNLTTAIGRVLALMEDSCVVWRPGLPDEVVVAADLTAHPPSGEQVYAGRCKVSARSAQGQPAPRKREIGEADTFESDYTLAIPLDAPRLRVGDLVLMGESKNPQMPGLSFEIRLPVVGTFKVSSKYQCELVAS